MKSARWPLGRAIFATRPWAFHLRPASIAACSPASSASARSVTAFTMGGRSSALSPEVDSAAQTGSSASCKTLRQVSMPSPTAILSPASARPTAPPGAWSEHHLLARHRSLSGRPSLGRFCGSRSASRRCLGRERDHSRPYAAVGVLKPRMEAKRVRD